MDRSNLEQQQEVGLNVPEKSIVSFNLLLELDWALGRVVAKLLNVSLLILILGIALTSLLLELTSIFEYQEGLSDISTLEAVFIVLTLVLLKRYIFYATQTSERWWNILSMPLIWYGRLLLFAWLTLSLLAFSDLLEGSDYLKRSFLHGENYIQIFSFSCILISLYISVPSKNKRKKALNFQTLDGGGSIEKFYATSQEQPQQTTSRI